MSGLSCLYDIPSLDNDGTNFHMWKFHVQMVLGVRHLWSVISGEDPKPDETTHPDEHKEWMVKDKEAHAHGNAVKLDVAKSQCPEDNWPAA